MKALQFKFNELPQVKVGDSYILQYVSDRKLSDINHHHDFYEIILILNGNAVQVINDNEMNMSMGDCIILKIGDTHFFKAQTPNIELLGISVLKCEFERFITAFSVKDERISPSIFSCITLLSEIKKIFNMCISKNNSVSDCRLLLCILFDLLCNNNKSNEQVPKLFECAMHLMHDSENIKDGVPALERLTNYSYPQLYRLMKKYYNKSPHEVVLDLRLTVAYTKISCSNLSIEDIMQSVGYNSLSHFNMIFKKYYGKTPSKIRKMCESVNTL